MSPITTHLTSYLAQAGVGYDLLDAATPASDGRSVVVQSTVIAMGEEYGLLVMPTGAEVSWTTLAHEFDVRRVRPASQSEVQWLFPGSDPDQVPAMGQIFGLPVYLATSLASAEHILFAVGEGGKWVRMTMPTFQRLTHPRWVAAGQVLGVDPVSDVPP